MDGEREGREASAKHAQGMPCQCRGCNTYERRAVGGRPITLVDRAARTTEDGDFAPALAGDETAAGRVSRTLNLYKGIDQRLLEYGWQVRDQTVEYLPIARRIRAVYQHDAMMRRAEPLGEVVVARNRA